MKKIKTSEIIAASQILETAKYTKMEDADKSKLLRIVLAFKGIADKFNEDTKTVSEKLKQSDFKGFDETLEKAQEYEKLHRTNGDMSKVQMGAAEYDKFISEVFIPFNKLVEDTMKPYAEKEVEIKEEALSESAFDKLMASNDWNISQVMFLSGVIRAKEEKKAEEEEKPKDKKKK
jgi:hypothetical protein